MSEKKLSEKIRAGVGLTAVAQWIDPVVELEIRAAEAEASSRGWKSAEARSSAERDEARAEAAGYKLAQEYFEKQLAAALAREAKLRAALREIRDETAAECVETGKTCREQGDPRGSWCSWCVADAALSDAPPAAEPKPACGVCGVCDGTGRICIETHAGGGRIGYGRYETACAACQPVITASAVPPPPNPPKIPDSSTAQPKSPFGWERLAVPGSRWSDKLGDASCMKEPGHDGPCVPIKRALAEDAPPALAHTVKEVAERFLPGVPESTIRMWISQAEECRAEAVRRSKVANPCPICTARASEDGLTRYAPKITEQLIDAKRAAPAMHLPAQMEELRGKLERLRAFLRNRWDERRNQYIDEATGQLDSCLRLVPVQHDDNMQAVEVEPACGPKHGADAPCDHCRKHGHTTPCIACACGEKTSSEVQP